MKDMNRKKKMVIIKKLRSGDKMVKRIWSENLMIKKVRP